MSSESDRLLIQGIRNGDKGAWEQLITRYEGRLLAFARQRLHDKSLCEDVVQETFIGFLTSLPNFDDRRELQTYLFTIASHKLTDHLRKTGRHPMQNAAEDVLEKKPDHNPAASSQARSQERRELESDAVARAIDSLLSHWREKGDYE